MVIFNPFEAQNGVELSSPNSTKMICFLKNGVEGPVINLKLSKIRTTMIKILY